MLLQSKKEMQLTKKDYYMSILHFFLHYVIIIGIVIAIIAINAGSGQAFKEYYMSVENRQNFVYMMLSILFIVGIILMYIYFESRDFLAGAKNIAVIFTVIEFSIIINYITGKYINIGARPFALCALLILLLVNKRTARYMNFCFCLIMFIIDVFGNQSFSDANSVYSSLVIGCVSTMLAIYLVDNVSSRIKVFLRGFYIAIPIVACSFALEYRSGTEIMDILTVVLYGFMSGITSVVYMMAVIPIFESLFNVLTNYRLAEITDHKSKLIQKIKDEAPGTFNHSLVVASLAESCAAAIGDNALLARACAYYHDIGKLRQPQYFAENQHGENPHDDLTPELSTEIIRTHTKDGYDLIKKYRLPKILADVAREHHGTLPIQYFYIKAQKFTDGEVNIADFCYQGPKPNSKIAAIVMLADGCEAAVRAQTDRTHEKVEKVVRGIIEDRMNNDQFSDCEITLRDIEIIRMTLVDSLTGVYHDRINYPKLKVVHQNLFASVNEDGTQKNGTRTTQKRTVKESSQTNEKNKNKNKSNK